MLLKTSSPSAHWETRPSSKSVERSSVGASSRILDARPLGNVCDWPSFSMATIAEVPHTTSLSDVEYWWWKPHGWGYKSGVRGPGQSLGDLGSVRKLGLCRSFWLPRHCLWSDWWHLWCPGGLLAWTVWRCFLGTGRPEGNKQGVTWHTCICELTHHKTKR